MDFLGARERLRGLVACALVAWTFVYAADATAAPFDKTQCFAAHEQGQLARKEGKLGAAAQQFAVCAADQCPAEVREECGKWLTDARNALPSVVPSAKGMDGRDLTDARVVVDGQVLAERLDGRQHELDPGPHVFVFELPDGTRLQERFVLNEGERNRQVSVDFSSLRPKSSQTTTERAVPTSVYVLAGVGLAALATGGVFGVLGKSKEDDLQNTCAPRCPDGEVSTMDTRYLIADISAGVGLVSLGAAFWLFLKRPTGETSPARAWVDLSPSRHGTGMVRWTARF